MSSQQIDRFILAMFKKEADRLLFETGTPVRIDMNGDERVILDQQVRTDQIDKLIVPVLQPADAATFQRDGEHEFTYDSPSGPVRIQARRSFERLWVWIFPGRREESPAAAKPRAEAPAPAAAPIHAASVHAAPGGKVPLVDQLLSALVKAGGSDLHLTAGQPPKMRKDGDMQSLPGFSNVLSSDQIRNGMFEVAHDKARSDFDTTNDSDYAHEIPGVARFRMNMFRDRNGVGAVVRQIPSQVLTADQLKLPPAVRNFTTLPKGLVTVTGPTGSGKSTTLAAMIDLINKTRADHIITVEDPVEFVHQSQKCLVNQREVHTHTASFARALKAALREDPDIVLVGEMRDLETVHIAIETAETGHLVFGTLHTNTAASTVDRIIDQFPTDRQSQIRVMLSESLRGVVAQTLCKKIGGGRVAVLEILVCNSAIANLIREGKTFQIPSLMQTGKAIGMQTQVDHMIELVKAKLITPEEGFAKAVDQNSMKGALERNGFKLEVAEARSGH